MNTAEQSLGKQLKYNWKIAQGEKQVQTSKRCCKFKTYFLKREKLDLEHYVLNNFMADINTCTILPFEKSKWNFEAQHRYGKSKHYLL